MSNAQKIADILAGKMIVNREEKMQRTINKMVDNALIADSKIGSVLTHDSADRGYGRGKRMGD